jgi:DNA-binding MarR family transcriptional regulator
VGALGYVKRSRNSSDSREVSVALTPKGRTVTSEIVPIALDLEKTAVAGISDRDIALVKRTLTRMHKNLITRD